MDNIIDLVLNTDNLLLALVAENIHKAYAILFLLILLETGLVFFPFLPGDGLLFSAGVVAASTNINILFLLILLISAAIIGNVINYLVGRFLGYEFGRSNNYFIKQHIMVHIPKAEQFYTKHGGSAIIIGRFFPIIRTYIPFFAGVVKMQRTIFIKNTTIGAILWISFFLLTGFFAGEIEWVKNNYGLIFVLLIMVTLFPLVYSIIKNKFKKAIVAIGLIIFKK